MTEEELKDIKNRYPDITEEESDGLSWTDWYKCQIIFYEKTIKDVKESLQDFFKNHKTWISNGAPEEDIEWYKDLLRDLKNGLEQGHRECMLEYKHHREGLNPPSCYKF
jgi:hypothetical protein